MDWRNIFIFFLVIALCQGENPRRRLRIRRRNDTVTDSLPSSSSSNSIRVKASNNIGSGSSRSSGGSSKVSSEGKKLVCYYTNWSQYRPKIGKFLPEDIPADLCTHLIFAFGWMKKGKLSSFESNDETKDGKVGLYERINILKKANPQLKTLLAIGGWSFGTQKFKEMSSTRYSRQLFVLSSIPYLRERNFDGLDIDWEYPKGSEDKANYVLLLKELHEAFEAEAEESGKPRLLLTAAVPVGPDSIRGGYDVPQVSTYLDFINLMAYDFHGKWESQTGHNAPLYAPSSDSEWRKQLSVSHAASIWMKLGAPKEKLVIGMPTYGRSFTLNDPRNFSVNVATKGGGVAGVYTREGGFLAYYEICEILKTNKAQYVWDDEMKVPYLVDGDQWVGFDDERSIKIKMDWVKSTGFAGAMVWTVDMDDFRGDVCGGGGKYPLIKVMREEMMGIKRDGVPVDWSKHSKKIVFKAKPEAVAIPVSEVIKRKLVKEKEVAVSEEEEEEDDLNTRPGNLVCYLDSAALDRDGDGKMSIDDVDGNLCTVLIYSKLNLKDHKINAADPSDVETFGKLLKLKEKNSQLKVLLSIGGDAALKEMTSSVYRMNNFVYESVEFLRERQFDGIDVDWNVDSRGAKGYTQLIKELRLAFEGEAKSAKAERLTLSTKLKSKSIKSLDLEELSKYVDFFNVVTYDFSDNKLSHHSPLHSISEGGDSLEHVVTSFLRDAPKEKVNVGVGLFSRTYELQDATKFDIGAGVTGGGAGGEILNQKGFLAYYEVCQFLDRPNTTLVWDNEQSVPFAYNNNQWIGFDDTRSLKSKTDWLKEEGLGGIFVYSIDLDDFSGTSCESGKFPLLKSLNNDLKGYRVALKYEGPYEGTSSVGPGGKKKTDPNEITCAEEDGHISYHKDKADCTKYFMCEGERKHHMPCPAQLVFNPNENVCDWPENVEGCMAS